MAARRFSRADRKELVRPRDGTLALARPRDGTLAANSRPSTGDVLGDPSVRAAARTRRMAATDPDRRQSVGHRVWDLPVRQQTTSARASADTAHATGALVLRRGDRAWRRTNARTNLSRALPGRRPRQGPRGGRGAHKRQSGRGRPGLPRPLYSDDRSRRIVGVAGLPVPGSQVRVAELVQSGCYLGLQSRLGGCSIAGDQPDEPALSRIALGLRRIR